jgi:hypothetical protein
VPGKKISQHQIQLQKTAPAMPADAVEFCHKLQTAVSDGIFIDRTVPYRQKTTSA